jgi:hypothetical protein
VKSQEYLNNGSTVTVTGQSIDTSGEGYAVNAFNSSLNKQISGGIIQTHATQPSPAPLADNSHHSSASNLHVDASTLYKQIRATLTPEEFEQFAANVAAFNSSEQTADETVRNIGKLVKDRMLMLQMRNLIYTALAESRRSSQSNINQGE